MKNFNLLTGLLLSTLVVFSSCKKDEEEDPPVVPPVEEDGTVVVTSNISENTTWSSDNIYRLAGRITVLDGATLTIDAGTVIKAEAGQEANSKALVIARGGKLNAIGTASAPIIFTSTADDITPEDIAAGNFGSPNLPPNIDGLWGGVIVLGKAQISASNASGDVSEVQIEGIPTSDPNGLYGGNDDNDNSGTLKYISIRHGGTLIGSGNEINGLTLGGVGSGTTIDHIEIVANQDDGVEWFGGTVSVSDVVSWNCGDDGLDTDQSWSGSCTNFVIAGASGHCFELDGPEGSYEATHSFSNGTVVVNNGGGDLINTDANSLVNLSNIYFTGIDEDYEGKINRVDAAGVNYSGITIDLSGVDGGAIGDYVNGDVPSGVTAGGSSQVNISELNWTWAAQSGALNGL